MGNATTVTDPLTRTTTTDYDSRNRKWHVWDPQLNKTIFGYDSASNVTTITRPDNRVETKDYDGMNRLVRHTVPKSATESLITTFGYWPSGKVFWVQDPKQQGAGPMQEPTLSITSRMNALGCGIRAEWKSRSGHTMMRIIW